MLDGFFEATSIYDHFALIVGMFSKWRRYNDSGHGLSFLSKYIHEGFRDTLYDILDLGGGGRMA